MDFIEIREVPTVPNSDVSNKDNSPEYVTYLVFGWLLGQRLK